MNKTVAVSLILIVLAFFLSAYFYPVMPEKVASHWNAKGEVDGYLPKDLGLFLMPVFSFGLLALFLIIPKIGPLKQNIASFRNYFDNFILFIIAFFLYIHVLTLFWSLGYRFNMTQAIMPAIAALFYYIGVLLKHAKMNWFIGIRTPWTLSNEVVWDKTHALGSKLFKICALIILVGLILPRYTIWAVLIPTIASVVYLFAFSYFEFQKQSKKK